jgi:hypothetical protein
MKVFPLDLIVLVSIASNLKKKGAVPPQLLRGKYKKTIE